MCTLSCGNWISMLKATDACASDPCLASQNTCHGPPNNVAAGTECLSWCCQLDWMKIGIAIGIGAVICIIIIIICCCCCCRRKKSTENVSRRSALYGQKGFAMQEPINY